MLTKRVWTVIAYAFPVIAVLGLIWITGEQAREIERLRYCVRTYESRERFMVELLEAVSPRLLPNLRNNRRVTCEFPEDQKN